MHLPEQDMPNHNEADRRAREVGDPIASPACDEITVTPEMVQAGLEELALYSPREDSMEFAEEIVASMFRRMLKIHRTK